MEYDTRLSAEYAGGKLDKLANRVHRDTLALIDQDDIPSIVKHFQEARAEYRSLTEKLKKLEAEIDLLSHDLIPTVFTKHRIDKTTNIVGVGRVTVNVRWSASVHKHVGMSAAIDWLRQTGNEGLIIETVPAPTLTVFAKARALEGNPLPDDMFSVTQSNFVSITG